MQSFFDRKIIHIDMDAFFAAIEQRDNPRLRGRPVIVGGSVESRGVVSTCSYEARAFGIHSAMPTFRAKKLCPHGIFVPGNYDKYSAVSAQIREIFYEYTNLVEPLSIDEAFLDVTSSPRLSQSATKLAREIQGEIFRRTQLTASAGVSYNKFLAKVASGMQKPAGITVIPPERALEFLENLPIEKFHGIGKVTASKLRNMNIRYGRDLKALDEITLGSHFGKVGYFYYRIVRGIDSRPVESEGERKSYGKEVTFARDLLDLAKIRLTLRRLSHKLAKGMTKRQLLCRTVSIKVKYDDFTTVTRAISFHKPTDDGELVGNLAVELIRKTDAGKRPVRLIGVAVSNFPSPEELARPVQLEFDFI